MIKSNIKKRNNPTVAVVVKVSTGVAGLVHMKKGENKGQSIHWADS